MPEWSVRGAWTLVVLAAGAAMVRGLTLTWHLQLTPQAAESLEEGRRWLLLAVIVLIASAVAAARRWAVSPWALAALVAAGIVAVVAGEQGWFPPAAWVVTLPLLLSGLTSGLLAPRRLTEAQDAVA